MSKIWNNLIDVSLEIEKLFNENFEFYSQSSHLWVDKFWKSQNIRKCHFNLIDYRHNQKMMLMHINIFPLIDAPIFGVDMVVGQNKITGAFIDYSPVNKNHGFLSYFENNTKDLIWKRKRDLPDWATDIFSNNMIMAGNVHETNELDQLFDVLLRLCRYYTENMHFQTSEYDKNKVKQKHNYYCHNQKLNPHLFKSLSNMGLNESQVRDYVNEVLFEEIC